MPSILERIAIRLTEVSGGGKKQPKYQLSETICSSLVAASMAGKDH